LKIAAIIPVKTFLNAKTRLELPSEKVEALCKIMLEEILQVLSISPKIEKIILLKNNFNASIVFPQDIPYIKTQDIDFMLKHQMHPNFAIIVPSRKFDGTNALVRMPINLMETHYDNDSYRNHMITAKEHTLNVAMVFVKRIMLDVDSKEDLKFLLEQNEKPKLMEKIKKILN